MRHQFNLTNFYPIIISSLFFTFSAQYFCPLGRALDFWGFRRSASELQSVFAWMIVKFSAHWHEMILSPVLAGSRRKPCIHLWNGWFGSGFRLTDLFMAYYFPELDPTFPYVHRINQGCTHLPNSFDFCYSRFFCINPVQYDLASHMTFANRETGIIITERLLTICSLVCTDNAATKIFTPRRRQKCSPVIL